MFCIEGILSTLPINNNLVNRNLVFKFFKINKKIILNLRSNEITLQRLRAFFFIILAFDDISIKINAIN